jgi:inorganic triphosphatase YgiF
LQTFVEGGRSDVRKISDKKIRRTVQKALSKTSLRPVFETVVQRTTRRIKVQDSEIEFAIDDGEVRAGGVRRDLREAELELKAGNAEGLLHAAEKLLAGHELKLSSRSKAERGHRLAWARRTTASNPRRRARPASPARIAAGRPCAPCPVRGGVND